MILRVISGEARGLRLKTVPGRNTRPTSDRVKEALYNILDPYIKGAKVLELYAGTGSLSIEALSRGAHLAVLVERNHAALKVIDENLAKTGYLNKSIVLKMDVFDALKKLSQSDEKFDIILIDPPYGTGLAKRTAMEVMDKGLLRNGGIMVAEYDSHDGSEDGNIILSPYREKRYGRTILAFYEAGS